MKEKIIEQFNKQFQGSYFDALNNSDQKTIEQIKNFISQALDQYADCKIKECLPRRKPMGVFSFVLRGEELEMYMRYKGFNDCIDQILLNKDKK